MESGRAFNAPFRKDEVEDYERKRYRGIDQRLVHAREKRILQKILKKVGEGAFWVLDIPCGYGRFSFLFSKRGMNLLSCDLSFHMVKRTGEKKESLTGHLGVVADGKRGLPFRQGVFDLLLSMRFFHHLHRREERKAVLDEFFRVTGKWIILSFYQRNVLHLFQRGLRKAVKKSKTRIKMISRREFKEEVEEAGFDIIRIYPVFKGIHSHQIVLLRKFRPDG